MEWQAGEGSKKRSNWVSEAWWSVVKEGDHTRFQVDTVVMAGEALKLGLEDGDRRGGAVCGRKDKRCELMKEEEKWCSVSWLGPKGDGTTEGGWECDGGLVVKRDAVGCILDGSGDADDEVVESS